MTDLTGFLLTAVQDFYIIGGDEELDEIAEMIRYKELGDSSKKDLAEFLLKLC